MPIGSVTRGTTGANRLRRVDRWIQELPALRRAEHPLVVDLGFGASPTTTLELHRRLATRRPDVEVVGIEIEPERVARGRAAAVPGVSFALGGFEVPLPRGRQATVIRALNVLRQYDETEVAAHWHRMAERLEPDGVLVEGTCNEVGRVVSWVDLTRGGPQSLTVSLRLSGLEHPSIVAERLPKVLIHRNVEGESVHRFLRDLDHVWTVNAGLADTRRGAALAAGRGVCSVGCRCPGRIPVVTTSRAAALAHPPPMTPPRPADRRRAA